MFSRYPFGSKGWVFMVKVGQGHLVMETDEYQHPITGFMVDRPLTHEDILTNYNVYKAVYHVEQLKNQRHRQQLLNFKDYRKVDVSHINRLRSLTEIYTERTDLQCAGKSIPIVEGYAILQPNFILATDISKGVDVNNFSETLGHRYVTDNLRSQIDDRLWELEGYRLMRNIHTLNTIIHNSGNEEATHIAITRIANGGLVIYTKSSDLVYIITYGDHYQPVITGSQGKLDAGYSVLDKETYLRIVTLIDTYIELQ